MTTQIQRVPALRFPEFSGALDVDTLKTITDYVDYRGKTPPKSDSGVFLVTAKNIKLGYIDYSLSEEFIAESNYESAMSRGKPKIGDVLITTEAPLGNVASIDREDIALAQRVIKFRGKENILDNYFLKYVFLSESFQNEIRSKASGGTVQGIKGKTLHNIKIAFATLPEQQKIASFLSSVDTKIELLTTKKAKLEKYKKGMMQKLFSQEIRFKDDEGKQYPEWELKKLGDVSNAPSYGMNSASCDYDGIHKYIRITDIDESSRKYMPRPLTSPEPPIGDGYRLESGDLVFSRTGASTGKCYLYKDSDGCIYFAGFLIRFTIVDADPYFVYFQTFTHKYRKWVSTVSMRSGQPGINASEYSNYSFECPSLPEQKKIADFLSSIENKIEQVTNELEKTKTFKNGLLQQMFV